MDTDRLVLHHENRTLVYDFNRWIRTDAGA